ncbi:MAG: putative ribosome quality control (RQC) complex YloA/Tae2 family protein [Candidatus Woesearchaeota archaeon]|jgi:predicted ribosome quality control (RQC) complex YloA/Tae2 family protein
MNISSVDTYYLVKELHAALESSRVDQIYQYDVDEFLIRFHKPGAGKVELYIRVPQAIYMISKRPTSAEKPQHFQAYLRKTIKGMIVSSITQLGFNRVISINLQIKDVKLSLIMELFDKGALFVAKAVDDKYEIVLPNKVQRWANRTIQKGSIYTIPESPFPQDVNIADIFEKEKNTIISKCLATAFGLGGFYAKIVCSRLGYDPSTPVNAVDAKKLQKELQALFSHPIAAHLLSDRVVSFNIDGSEPIPTLSAGYDALLTEGIVSRTQLAKQSVHDKKIAKLQAIVDTQTGSVQKLKDNIIAYRELGEAIYANQHILEPIIGTFREEKKKHPDKELQKKLSDLNIDSYDAKEKTIAVTLK